MWYLRQVHNKAICNNLLDHICDIGQMYFSANVSQICRCSTQWHVAYDPRASTWREPAYTCNTISTNTDMRWTVFGTRLIDCWTSSHFVFYFSYYWVGSRYASYPTIQQCAQLIYISKSYSLESDATIPANMYAKSMVEYQTAFMFHTK